MQYLRLNNLSFQYDSANDPLFCNIHLDFSHGWSAIVGQNGSGKTTLLKLIAKQLRVQNGTISGNEICYYCEQSLDTPPEGFEAFREDYSAKRYRLQELLGIDDAWLYRFENLSYGEQKRIQIAVALYSEADVLLLDEPTNHLDVSTKAIVINALQSFQKIGLIVSHDREVLNRLCNHTVILKNAKIHRYKTNYSSAMEAFTQEQGALLKEHEEHNQKIKSMQKNIQRQKERVARTKGRLSKKHIDKHDSSAKEKINLAKFTGRDRNDSQKVDTLGTKLEHLNAQKITIDKEYPKGIVLEHTTTKKSPAPITLPSGELQLGTQKTLQFPDIVINYGDKIAITGDNGTGKSSFIKHLLSTIEANDILYIPQEIDTVTTQKLFASIEELSDSQKGELFSFVTRLSSNPKQILTHTLPSPGELRKLLIAKAMLDNIAMIVLDEPTNHMDIDSIIALEEALRHYNGTVILISHDRVFLDNTVEQVWEIVEGRLLL